MTTDFRPGHWWLSCSQPMSWRTVTVRVSMRPWSPSTVASRLTDVLANATAFCSRANISTSSRSVPWLPFKARMVLAFLSMIFLSDVALAAHGVDGHHRALDGQQVEQRGNGDDLVGLVADLGLPEHHALARGEGRDDMNGLVRPLLPVGAPHRLAVDGDHLGRLLVSAAVHATKQRWNATGSSLARMMPSWSCEGVPLPKRRKR